MHAERKQNSVKLQSLGPNDLYVYEHTHTQTCNTQIYTRIHTHTHAHTFTVQVTFCKFHIFLNISVFRISITSSIISLIKGRGGKGERRRSRRRRRENRKEESKEDVLLLLWPAHLNSMFQVPKSELTALCSVQMSNRHDHWICQPRTELERKGQKKKDLLVAIWDPERKNKALGDTVLSSLAP